MLELKVRLSVGFLFLACGVCFQKGALGQEAGKADGPGRDRLLDRISEQDRRIQDLEKLAGIGPAGESAAAPEAGWLRWGDLSKKGSRFHLYGFLRLDVIFDDSRPNNTQTIAFVRSEDRNAPPDIGNAKDEEDLTIHPRLTRLGLNFDGPRIELLGAKVDGKLEIDFYNSGLSGQSESRAAIRMRHAYLRLLWNDVTLLAGQTADLISPLYPIVNADLVMWGAGNLGDRRPQIRLDYAPAVGSGNLYLQGMVGLTGADDNTDLDAPGTFGAGFRDGETSGLPTIQGRIAYAFPVWKARRLEVGVWGHGAWEDPDTRVGGTEMFKSYAVGGDIEIPLYEDILWFKGEAWWGANLDDVRGGIFQGINTVTGSEIKSRGGWAEVGYKVCSWYSVSAGYSQDDPINSDLNPGGRAANKIPYLANRFNFDPVTVGFDYMYWRTDYVGFDKGDDNRFYLWISYAF